jgi:hypothetical protein
MRRRKGRSVLDERHQRVSGLVWGLLLIGLGAILGLQEIHPNEPALTEHAAERAVDGDSGTRWASQFDDDEWIGVDLGASVEIAKVRLVWEGAHARVYEIEVSDDGSNWRSVFREENGEGGTEEHAIQARARWVRVHGIERATGYGFSLWELEVFGPPEPGQEAEAEGPLLSRNQPVQASSRETLPVPFPFLLSFWFAWWPLFVIASGLPHLLVPRSDGEEIGGLVTVAVGVVFLLDNLDWTLRQAAPIALVVVGLVIVIQGLRRATRGEQPDPEEETPPR